MRLYFKHSYSNITNFIKVGWHGVKSPRRPREKLHPLHSQLSKIVVRLVLVIASCDKDNESKVCVNYIINFNLLSLFIINTS